MEKERKRKKTFTRAWWEEFLQEYARIQIIIFLTIVCGATLIIILFPSKFITQTITEKGITDETIQLDYKQISIEELERRQQEQTRINIIGFASLIGWCAFNPEFRRGITKIIKKIRESENENKERKQDKEL